MKITDQFVLSAMDGWIILLIFSAIWIFLGWFWGRKNKTLDDFMLAGRNVGMALGVATAMATWVTTSTTMAAPQFALQLGIWGMLGYSLGSVGLMLFAPLAKRIKQLMPAGYTSGDFIRLRYGRMNIFHRHVSVNGADDLQFSMDFERVRIYRNMNICVPWYCCFFFFVFYC